MVSIITKRPNAALSLEWQASMRAHATMVVLALSLALAACRPPAANPRVVGTYVATNGESLMFLPNTRVAHMAPQSAEPQRLLLGSTRPVLRVSNAVEVFAPDASPFLGTRFEFDTDFTTITVRWRDHRPNAQTRQTRYLRKGDQ